MGGRAAPAPHWVDRRRPLRQDCRLRADRLQDRGTLFIGPGEEVYEGMIIGKNARAEDMDVNVTKEKQQTNMRAAAADVLERMAPPTRLSLEASVEFLREDECVEITPNSVRLRKVELDKLKRQKRARHGVRAA